MRQYRLTDQAEEDLHDIWSYIATDNLPAADRLMGKFHKKFQALADMPGMGPLRPEFGESLRSSPVGTYLVFYRRIAQGIEVARVLSGFRDLPALFEVE